ncbi:MAG: hypothetical protein V3W31_06250 [Thermodesulfobacteriota bacterium]
MRGRTTLIPSIADVLFITVFIRLLLSGSDLLSDSDTGLHIRAGRFILDAMTVPVHEPFTFLSPPLTFPSHEWLSEVVMAWLYAGFGLEGVVFFSCFVLAATVYLFFKMLRADDGNIILAAVILVLAVASSWTHWLARPHIFSIFFLVVWYYLLDDYQYRATNRLYFLPPLMLLWVNLHAAFVLGFALTGLYLFGNIVRARGSGGAEKEIFRGKVRALALVMGACIAASLVSPGGYHALLFPLKLGLSKVMTGHIGEYLSPDFHKPSFAAFEYMLLLMIAVFAFSKRSLNVMELLLVMLFTPMALYSSRHIPFFAVAAAPILLRHADAILDRLEGRFAEFLKEGARRFASMGVSSRGSFWPAAVVLAALAFLAAGKMDYDFDEEKKPVEAVEFLKKEKIPGNMFNNDEFGDYMVYAAWPEYRVFMNGSYDADKRYYTRMEDYSKVFRIKPQMDGVIEKYDISWVIFNSGSSLSNFLLQREDWLLIYSDGVADIFLKDTPENERLIEKYRDVKPVVKEEEDGAP